MAVAAGAALAATILAGAGAATKAGANSDLPLTSVPANADVRGVTVPDVLSPELSQIAVAQGSIRLENPTPEVPYHGYDGNGTRRARPSRTRTPTCACAACTAPTRTTATARTSCSRATRAAPPGTSPGSTSTPMSRTA